MALLSSSQVRFGHALMLNIRCHPFWNDTRRQSGHVLNAKIRKELALPSAGLLRRSSRRLFRLPLRCPGRKLRSGRDPHGNSEGGTSCKSLATGQWQGNRIEDRRIVDDNRAAASEFSAITIPGVVAMVGVPIASVVTNQTTMTGPNGPRILRGMARCRRLSDYPLVTRCRVYAAVVHPPCCGGFGPRRAASVPQAIRLDLQALT